MLERFVRAFFFFLFFSLLTFFDYDLEDTKAAPRGAATGDMYEGLHVYWTDGCSGGFILFIFIT